MAFPSISSLFQSKPTSLFGPRPKPDQEIELQERFPCRREVSPDDTARHIGAAGTRQPPPPGTPAHHAEAALALLRAQAAPPLADLLCSDVDADRREALQRLDALASPEGPLSDLEDHDTVVQTMRNLRVQAHNGELPPPEVIRDQLRTVAGVLQGIGPASSRQAADMLSDALKGKRGKTLADALNSSRTAERCDGSANLEALLEHLQKLSRLQGATGVPGPDGAPPALPAALVTELHRFVLTAGHAMLPEQRVRLLGCNKLGLPLEAWMEKCQALSATASETVKALREKPKPATDGVGREYPPPSTEALSRVSQAAKCARELVNVPAPQGAVTNRAASFRVALRGPFAALVRDMKTDEAAELHRRMMQPECRALRRLATEALGARQAHDEGNADQAARIAAERQQLEDWLVAYDELLQLLEQCGGLCPHRTDDDPFDTEQDRALHTGRTGVPPAGEGDGAASFDADGSDSTGHAAARARELFQSTFGFPVNGRPEPPKST